MGRMKRRHARGTNPRTKRVCRQVERVGRAAVVVRVEAVHGHLESLGGGRISRQLDGYKQRWDSKKGETARGNHALVRLAKPWPIPFGANVTPRTLVGGHEVPDVGVDADNAQFSTQIAGRLVLHPLPALGHLGQLADDSLGGAALGGARGAVVVRNGRLKLHLARRGPPPVDRATALAITIALDRRRELDSERASAQRTITRRTQGPTVERGSAGNAGNEGTLGTQGTRERGNAGAKERGNTENEGASGREANERAGAPNLAVLDGVDAGDAGVRGLWFAMGEFGFVRQRPKDIIEIHALTLNAPR